MNMFGVRSMRPEDVPAAVAIHLRAFPSFFLSSLGERFLRLLYGEVVGLGEMALVAEDDRQILGSVFGTVRPSGFYRALLRRRLFSFALASLPAFVRQPSIAPRLLRALRRPSAEPAVPGQATLMSISVDPTLQTRGVGRALVGAFLEEAWHRGANSVELTTDALANERVTRFYEGLGFVRLDEFVTPEGRRMLRYSLDLADQRANQ